MTAMVNRSPSESPIRYAYVLATAYSGSTILSLLLDSHPRIVSIGELDNEISRFPAALPYRCSCGNAIDECEFFSRVRDLCAQERIELDLQNFRVKLGAELRAPVRRLLFESALQHRWLERVRDRLLSQLPIYRRHVKQLFDRNVAIARACIKISGKDLFVDTSKTFARVPHLVRRAEIDLRIIHVVRDVRAVAWSALKRERAQVEHMSRYWVRTHTRALQLGANVGEDRYLRFRWEDFCAEPKAVLDQICGFLGVEHVDVCSRVNTQTHHVIGNRIRLQPVLSINSDESWRHVLDPPQLLDLERCAGPLNRSFGYA